MQIVFRYLLILLALGAMPFKALAENLKDSFEFSYNYYSDNVGVLVNTPFLGLQKRLSTHWGMNLSFQADAISAASMRSGNGNGDIVDNVIIDAVSGASGRYGFDDYRVAPTLSLTYEKDNFLINFGSYYSNEVDYDAIAGFFDGSYALNDANTILSLGGSYEASHWSPTTNRELSTNDKTQYQVNASLLQLLSPEAYVQFKFSYIDQEGFLASPYHYLVSDSFAQFDRYPETRKSMAAAMLFVGELTETIAFHLNYRYYSDDWKIASHTAEAQLFFDLSDSVMFGVRGRYYLQDKAYFTKELGEYSVNDDYIVSDYKYSAFNTTTTGVNLHYRPESIEDEPLVFQLSYDRYFTNDNDYIQNWYGQKSIQADLVSLSVTYDF